MQMKFKPALIVVALVALNACDEEPTTHCDVWVSSASVSGRVVDGASSAPIVNTEVLVRFNRGACGGSSTWDGGMSTTTDSNGMFSVELEVGNSSGVYCVAATEVNSGVEMIGEVELGGGCGNENPPGSVSFDLVVGSRAQSD